MAESNVLRMVPPVPKRTSPAAVVLAGLVIVCRAAMCVLAGAEVARLFGIA